MSYQTFSIASLADIPALVATFAAANGWTVNTAIPAEPTFTHPSLPGAESFRLKTSTSGYDSALQFEHATTPTTVPLAKFISPKLNQGTNTPDVRLPTVLHAFCSQTPEPHIALVVEYGYNSYRHLYFGYIEKVGTFTGGEVLGAASPPLNQLSRNHFTETDNQYLFRGRQSRWANIQSGGAHLVHANNPNPWRKFHAESAHNALEEFLDTEIFGGFQDNINDGFVAFGKSPFAGSNILTPINLYAVRNPGVSAGFAPVGRPSGVRMVNMQDLSPGGQILVGGSNWRVFPAFSKQSSQYAGSPTAGQWPTYDSSYYAGYAYLES